MSPSFRVHLWPNLPYLAFLVVAAVATAIGVVDGGVLGALIAVCGAVMLLAFAGPVVVSTLCRVPVLVVDPDGVRLPIMGIRLGWAEVARTERTVKLDRRGQPAVLLIVPADPDATIRQVRPWLRRQVRADQNRYGAPIVLSDLSLNRSLEEISGALRSLSPRS